MVKYHDQKFRYNEVEVSAKPSRDSRLVNPENLTLMIAKLTAILRLANSMDRSHLNKLADCKLNVRENQLVISTDYSGDVTLEAISIAEKGDFFEEIFGVRPVLRAEKESVGNEGDGENGRKNGGKEYKDREDDKSR